MSDTSDTSDTSDAPDTPDETAPESAPEKRNQRDPASKSHHIEVCLTDAVEYEKSTGFERFAFVNNAVPEVSLEDIDLSTSLVGKPLNAPLMIASMTGGVTRAGQLNQLLAAAAERWQIPMGVGSQRVAIEDESRAASFRVRDVAPTTLIFANIGGVQLVKGWTVDHCRRAVEMIEADALFLHLNPIQEAIQGGDQDFRGMLDKISEVCRVLDKERIPVFAREVGFGMSPDATRRLVDAGIKGIDCSGAGGTSWAKVEGLVAKTQRRRVMGTLFGEWGIPTTQSILNVRSVSQRIPLIACGGLRSGVDVAKAIALGADIGAMARPMLIAADQGEEALDAFIEQTLTELRICMFGIGVADIEGLKGTPSLTPVV